MTMATSNHPNHRNNMLMPYPVPKAPYTLFEKIWWWFGSIWLLFSFVVVIVGWISVNSDVTTNGAVGVALGWLNVMATEHSQVRRSLGWR